MFSPYKMTTISYDLTFSKVMKLKRLTDYSSWRTLIKYSLMSAELWNLIVKNDIEISSKSDVLSQSVMTEEFISETTMTTLMILTDIT